MFKNNLMTPSLNFLQDRFKRFNNLYFQGNMPPVDIRLSNARTFLGRTTYIRHHDTGHPTRFIIYINTRIPLTTQEVEDVLIHEMIHVHIAASGLDDTSAHGPRFQAIMEHINQNFNRNVSVTYSLNAHQQKRAFDSRPRWHVIAIISFHDGHLGVKVLPRNKQSIRQYQSQVIISPLVKFITFYLTNNPFFNHYPCSSALKAYAINTKEARIQLRNAYVININSKNISI